MDSIIFDLDGTLWDPIDTVLSAWNSALSNHPKISKALTRKDFESTMGLQMNEIMKKLFPELDGMEQLLLINEFRKVEETYLVKQGGILYPNVENVLQALSQKYQLCIVSNCQDGYIEAFFKYHQLEKYFIDYESHGRTGLSKGENIQLVIERNCLSNPVYVGDTEGDLVAARFANIPFIFAQYGFGQTSQFDLEIKSFDELLKIFTV